MKRKQQAESERQREIQEENGKGGGREKNSMLPCLLKGWGMEPTEEGTTFVKI